MSVHSLACPLDRTSLEARTLDFLGRWGVSFDEMCAAYVAIMAPGCAWEQRPMLVTRGPLEAVRFLRFDRRCLGLDTIVVEVPHIAQIGDVVLTERIDHLLRRNGTIIASAIVAGTFEFDDGGSLVAWREHLNVVGFTSQILRNMINRKRRVHSVGA